MCLAIFLVIGLLTFLSSVVLRMRSSSMRVSILVLVVVLAAGWVWTVVICSEYFTPLLPWICAQLAVWFFGAGTGLFLVARKAPDT
jgi:hypothetical protein